MNTADATSKRSYAVHRMVAAGVLLGLLFPVLGTILSTGDMAHVSSLSLLEVHRRTPLLWLLDALPFVFGLAGYLVVLPATERTVPGHQLTVLVLVVTLLPTALLLYALRQDVRSVETASDIALAGAIASDAVWVYEVTREEGRGDYRTMLRHMRKARDQLIERYPLAADELNGPWQPFERAAANRNALRWDDVNRLRVAAERTGEAIRARAERRSLLSMSLLSLGVVFMVLSLLKSFSLLRRLRKATATLAAMAIEDGLTGLANHRTFQERLLAEYRRTVRHGAPLSLLMLDIDKFKDYNDAFGHLAGDDVLRTIADVLRATARETDFVARYGGEEFVVVLPHTTSNEAVAAGERLRFAVERTRWPHRPITVSVGSATFVETMKSPEVLIERADQALYRSKAQGRNRVTSADWPDIPSITEPARA